MESSQPLESREETPRSAVYVNSSDNFVFNAEHIEVNIHIGDRPGATAKPALSVVGSSVPARE